MSIPNGLGSVAGDPVGIAYLLTGLVLLLLIRQPLAYLEKPGSRGFLLAVIAISLWPLSVGLNTFVSNLALSKALFSVRLLAAALVSVGWFLLAYEFTTQRFPSRRLLAGLVGYVLLGQLLAWTNPVHSLVLGAGTAVQNGVLVPVQGPWFWIQASLNYGLILAATGLLTTDYLRSTGIRRQQSALLALAVVPPVVANLVTILDIVNTVHDLTPFGLLGSGLILSWTLYRLEFLNIVPVGRDVAVEVMEDAVVTIDDSRRVIDCNEAAKDLFAVGQDFHGDSLRKVLDRLPAPVLDRLMDSMSHSDTGDVQIDLQVEIDGTQRHFSLTRSSVSGTGDTRLGQVLVFRDITPLKRREADLDLLRQVLTRILRHNLRTNLNVIEGYAELLRSEYDDERHDRIIEASVTLEELSEKATHLETIIQPDTGDVDHDLSRLISAAVESVRTSYPSVVVNVDVPDSVHLQLSPGFPTVLDIILENAVEHNSSEEPHVAVQARTESDRVVVKIADNGPGIPEHELAVLESREESPLHHGSGLGLWIVRWWADRADVKLSFNSDSEGTTVTFEFPVSADATTN